MNGTEAKASRHSGMEYRPPDPEILMEDITDEIKELKQEVRRLFEQMKDSEKDLEKVKVEAKEIRRVEQEKKLKGLEVTKLDQLVRMGFDAEVVKDHIEKESKALEKIVRARQKERKNIETNIKKMTDMNKQSEKAVTAVQNQYNQLVVSNQKNQLLLDNAELGLYSVESKLKHYRQRRAVENSTKDAYKKVLKDIVGQVKKRAGDDDVLAAVLKIAGKCLSADAGVSSRASDFADDSSSSDSSISISLSSLGASDSS